MMEEKRAGGGKECGPEVPSIQPRQDISSLPPPYRSAAGQRTLADIMVDGRTDEQFSKWFMGRNGRQEFRDTLSGVIEENRRALDGFRRGANGESAFELFLWAPRLIRAVQFQGYASDLQKIQVKTETLNYCRAVYSANPGDANPLLDGLSSRLDIIGARLHPAYERADRITWSSLNPITLSRYMAAFDKYAKENGLDGSQFLFVPLLYGAMRVGLFAEAQDSRVLSFPLEVIRDVPTMGATEAAYFFKISRDRVPVIVNEDNAYGYSLRVATEFVNKLTGKAAIPSSVTMNVNTNYPSAFYAEMGFM